MRLTVFGATGGTGRQLVRLARAGGHEVVAVVRTPQTVEGIDGVVADVFDYRDVYADLECMEQVLAAGRADWTVVRPPYLTDGPATGAYRSALEANVPGGSISRADLARALLDVLADPASVRHAIGVARAAA